MSEAKLDRPIQHANCVWHELAVPPPLPTVWRWASRRWVADGISVTSGLAAQMKFRYVRPRPDVAAPAQSMSEQPEVL
jgi:hypothetical protein